MMLYWQIVPVDDGYHFLNYIDGSYVLQHKALAKTRILLFKSRQSCIDYIAENLDDAKYTAEEVWLNEKFFEHNE